MLGFLFGTACLVGLIVMLKRGRFGRHHGYGPPWAREADCEGRSGHRFGPLGFVFRRLDTTPGQEKTIRDASDELMEQLRSGRKELKKSREDIADAMRADYFDPEKLGEVFARHDAELVELRKTAVASLSRVHETLDERQRRELAEILAGEGFGPRRWGGPYRSWS